ncbi:MAG: DUF2779 domain-containing protein [Clostridia bacterium]|nr:DUF2779 domain-containing protein [Clostridia bacterium]
MLWLDTYRPELHEANAADEARFTAGNEVGDLAMGLFGDYVEVTAKKENGRLDLSEMIRRTEEEMKKGTPVICEASFSFGGLYCAVDLLKKENGGWAIYEVKSSTHVSRVYCADVAYQKYVLENCGVRVTGTYLVTIDSGYVYDGTLRLDELFCVTDISAGVAVELQKIEPNLETAEHVLADGTEPRFDISERCRDPYGCDYWGYCTRALPTPNVFDLYRVGFKNALKYYYDGVASFEALLRAGKVKNKTALRQIDFALNDRGTFTDREAICAFLDTLSYPLYFLDFETMQLPVPKYVGSRPYQQIPFQYSLHYIEKEGGEVKHKEFLAESGPDPRRALAQRLCADIPKDVCVTAYNRGFECGRIKELAAAFPDLAEHLLNIEGNIKDLLTPFQSGWYYNRAMGGSFSIKSVLPALFPDDPELDYHNLEGVHNGSEAMEIFPRIEFMPPEEKESARRNLLKYCELDTLAMVKVWEKLKDII